MILAMSGCHKTSHHRPQEKGECMLHQIPKAKPRDQPNVGTSHSSSLAGQSSHVQCLLHQELQGGDRKL